MKFVNPAHRRCAFTLIELLIVIAVIAIISTILVPSFRGVLTASRDTAAITKTEALNGALFTFSKRVSDASTQWAAANNSQRYTLLYNAGYMPNAPETLAEYTPSGYTITFPNSVNGRCGLSGPSGTISY